MRLWRSFTLFLRSHKRGLLVTLAVFVGLYILLNASFYAVSMSDASCTVCHFITPYHRSWQQSSHEGVACVRCHDLGFGYFTSALFKTATGLYNPRPVTVVKNEACLQSDCHQLQVVYRSTGLRQRVAFDHRSHLRKMRRGEKLWCTSCHSSYGSKGTHFATNEATCFICHFKGAEQGRSVTECSTCHTAPAEVVEHSGFRFNHQAYVSLGVSCEECHIKITRGDANADPDRCHDCHSERLGGFDNFELMHDKHVSERGISCFRCHSEIEHGSVEFISVLDVQCANCHSELHSPQKELYMGVGGKGLADVPSRMFAAKVSCEGCHTAGAGAAKKVSYEEHRQACVRCHGEGYDLMLDDWMREMKNALDYVAPLERSANNILASLDQSNPRDAETAEFIRDALANIDLARSGIGAHNAEYAIKMIDTGIDQISLAHQQLGRRLSPGARPAVLVKPDGYCTSLCHNRIASHGVEFFAEMEIDFDHEAHEHVSCTRCHSAQKHKQRIISKGECMSCHHTEEGQEYGVGCSDCHGAVAALYQGTARVPGVEIEPDVMAESDVSCVGCHQVSAAGETLQTILQRCNKCHEEWEAEPYPVDDYFVENEVALQRSSDRLLVELERSRVAVDTLERQGRDTAEMKQLLSRASEAVNAVMRGKYHHNFPAAEAILTKAGELLKQLELLTGN